MQSHTAEAIRLMSNFAERTGVGSDAPRRYLWTDAFALMNALDLWRETRERRWRDLATGLIAKVHWVLGRHRPDDAREGWLSGLREEEGLRHPTAGGLRIGKPLPERGAYEPYDERLEWDREGQYWHYLTKWMDALSRAAVLLGEPHYQDHAEELAEATFPRFLQRSATGAPSGLAWKMSTDLSRPQVAGISPHDALDGYVTFRWLGRADEETKLANEAAILRRLAKDRNWATVDPLGLGGLLLDAMRLSLLPDRRAEDERLISSVLAGVDVGLAHFLHSGALEMPPARRLGFRELGLAIGLQALPVMSEAAGASGSGERPMIPHIDGLRGHAGIGSRIVALWSDPENQCVATWSDHRDINEVMLATALLDAYSDTARPPSAPDEPMS